MAQGVGHREILAALASISDERVLHTVVLELARAGSSVHAKVNHGPVEYGKDVLVVEHVPSGLCVKCFAIKAGDINARNWPTLKESLEQAMTVTIQDPIVRQYMPLPVVVVALFNGHINAFTEPVVAAWRDELLARGRVIEFMGIDALARWVIARGLGRRVVELAGQH